MKINGTSYQSIWINEKGIIQVFDQRNFPHQLDFFDINTLEDSAYAIKEMVVRGAPLIGVTAAYGLHIHCKNDPSAESITKAAEYLKSTRPTAVNLMWAVDRCVVHILNTDESHRAEASLHIAHLLKDEDVETCRAIGEHGLKIIEEISTRKKGGAVNILTHCNAGWLACIDWGTATSPIYQAYNKGINVHVWVDETRPRNQGANLTAFELGQHGVPHTLITDNAGGHLMQHGMIDFCIVGTDRTTREGDVANKIGTYLKALAAKDNNVPFYVALPSSTIDWNVRNGVREIPIEERNQNEVKYIRGAINGEMKDVLICPESTQASNYGFDVTPARLVTGLITERGICTATEEGLLHLFPEQQ